MMYNNSFLDDFKYAFQRRENALQQIILINVIVFIIAGIIQLLSPSLFVIFESVMSIPLLVKDFLLKPWTLVTHFFTHYGFSHILWNMIGLYWFGKLIKEYLGNDKLIALYILGGLVGGISILALYGILPSEYASAITGGGKGASAAVFAIAVGAATLMPNYSFNLLFIGPVKIKYIAAAQVFISLISVRGPNMGGEVAHLGGALMGYIYINQLQKGNDLGQWVTSVLAFFKSFFVRQPKMKVNYSTSPRRKKAQQKKASSSHSNLKSDSHTPDQDEIDAILDKISQSGYESLSREEKQKLFNASKK